MKKIVRPLVHLVFRTGQFRNKEIERFAKRIRNKKILELGSGKREHGKQVYSVKRFFHPSNEFIQTDIDPKYGHKIVDVTKMKDRNTYDIILCLNVLEHVYDFHTAIENLHRAVKKGGIVVVFVPTFYPLHDEPADYWRFTEHALRKLLRKFSSISLKHRGVRQFPSAYYVECKK